MSDKLAKWVDEKLRAELDELAKRSPPTVAEIRSHLLAQSGVDAVWFTPPDTLHVDMKELPKILTFRITL